MAELGDSVRKKRKERRLTQQDLAMAAGVGRGVLQKLEEGRGTVNVNSLILIAQGLSCDVQLVPRHAPAQVTLGRIARETNND